MQFKIATQPLPQFVGPERSLELATSIDTPQNVGRLVVPENLRVGRADLWMLDEPSGNNSEDIVWYTYVILCAYCARMYRGASDNLDGKRVFRWFCLHCLFSLGHLPKSRQVVQHGIHVSTWFINLQIDMQYVYIYIHISISVSTIYRIVKQNICYLSVNTSI